MHFNFTVEQHFQLPSRQSPRLTRSCDNLTLESMPYEGKYQIVLLVYITHFLCNVRTLLQAIIAIQFFLCSCYNASYHHGLLFEFYMMWFVIDVGSL